MKRFLPSKRRLIQLYAALLYNANLKGFIKGDIYTGPVKNLCVPGLNCYSCPGAVGACPLGALQNALASSGNRAPYYVLGILMLFGLALGRTICGWLCPMGLAQELLHKIPTPKLKKNRVTRALSWLKYVLLGLFVVWIPLAYVVQRYPVPAFCKYICPAGTLEGAVGLLANPANADKFSMLGLLFSRKFIILVLICAACIFIYRAFCRFLCPLGAIYGLFARLSVLGVKVEASKCTDCGKCLRTCQMDIRRVGDHECIHCGDCVGACPTKAISFKGGKIFLRENEGKPEKKKGLSIAAWVLALLILGGALWYFNKPEPAKNTPVPPAPAASAVETQAPVAFGSVPAENSSSLQAFGSTSNLQAFGGSGSNVQAFGGSSSSMQAFGGTVSNAPTGSDVGMLCPDFTVPIYGGGEFSPADVRGKVTVINFWATWCTPCVQELPHFQELHENYPDVAMVAIHSNLITDDVEEYLSHYDYTLPFALDESGDVIASLGGSTMLPMTVVLDADGRISYNKVGSVDYPTLEKLVQEAMQ